MILYDSPNNATNPNGLIQRAWIAYKGNTNWPSSGANYLRMVMIANSLKNQWALDAKVHWDSLFSQNNSVGTVASNNQAYALPTNVFFLADYVYILRTDGNIDRFQVVHPEQRFDGTYAPGQIPGSGDALVFMTGSFKGGAGNLTLNFVTPWAQMLGDVGGTIRAGTYVLPADMVNATDVVPVDNPEWLVQALAAELARNDPAKEDQYASLQGVANDLYKKMVKANQGNSWQQPNSPEYVQPITPGIGWGTQV